MPAGNSVKKSLSEILYVTVSNLRGHLSLYRQGWFVVSSSAKTFRYAKAHSITASGRAISCVIDDVQTRSAKYGENMLVAGKEGVQLGKDIYAGGTRHSKQGLAFTKKLIKNERRYGAEILRLAWQRFVKGNMTLAKRTAEDRAAIIRLPSRWYKAIRNDANQVRELTRSATKKILLRVTGHWGDAFAQAKGSFNEAYEKSGNCGNAFSGLGHIFVGYCEAMYAGLIKPIVRSIVQGVTVMVKGVSILIFLPVALAVIVCGRTIQTAGFGLYYIAAMAVKLVSPTVEGGLLTALSMLLYAAIPFTVIIGLVVVAMNQIVVIVASPIACVSIVVLVSAVTTSVYAAQVSYDVIKGLAKISFNQAQSASVLAYNALTALPTHLLLGTMNVIVFLAYDVPRLAIASVKGEVLWSN